MNEFIQQQEGKTTKRRLKLPEDLKVITEKSNSFDEDIHLLAVWFELGARRKKIEAIIKSVIEMPKISWENIIKALETQEIRLTETDRIQITIKMSQKLKKTRNKITPIMFFRLLKKLQEN